MSEPANQAGSSQGEREQPEEGGRSRRAWQALALLALWRIGALRARRRGPRATEADSATAAELSERRVGAPGWAEAVVPALLALTALATAGFVALFVLDPNTQLLGLCLGVGLSALAGALVVAGAHLVPQETRVESRPIPGRREGEIESVAREARAGVDGVTRRRLLAGAAGVAGASLTAAVAIPVVALGPGVEDQLRRTPWRSGRRLVDDQGKPMLAAGVNEGGFLTAFPEGADQEDLGSPVVVVRVDPATLRLPAERATWAPEGILAYSKICTHAACAISLYRSPLSPSTQSRGPALVCPCHYSTFNVLDGASVEFGPAGRPLPQLPLAIDATGSLIAAGPLSGPVGPAWWGDRA